MKKCKNNNKNKTQLEYVHGETTINHRTALWAKAQVVRYNLDVNKDSSLSLTSTENPHYMLLLTPTTVFNKLKFPFPFSKYSLIFTARTFCSKYSPSLLASTRLILTCHRSPIRSRHLPHLHICFVLLFVDIYFTSYVSAFRGQG